MFLSIYGSPALQAAVGIDPDADVSPKPQMSPEHRKLLDARIAELKSQIGKGGLRECVMRGMLYIGMARGMVDERSIEALRRVRAMKGPRLTLAQFKMMVREQFFMLLLEPEASLAAIPKLLPQGEDERRAGLAVIREVVSASAEISGEIGRRLDRVTQLFGLDGRTAGEGVVGPSRIGEWNGGHPRKRRSKARRQVRSSHRCGQGDSGSDDHRRASLRRELVARRGRRRGSRHHQADPCRAAAKIKAAASKHSIDISGYEIVDAPHSEAAAAKAVELINEAKGEMLMKGSLHTDELMRSVTAKTGGLRTERRISHVFIMDVPA